MLTERSRYLTRKAFGPAVRIGTAGVLLFSSISCGEGNQKSSEDSSKRSPSLVEMPFNEGNWRFTGGPHADFGNVRNALDFAPENPLSCTPEDEEERYQEEWVTSPVSGRVLEIGSPANTIEIAIDNTQGLGIDVLHLANLQIQEGDKVSVGEKLGYPSCEGETNGAHVHIALEKNGKPFPINNVLIADEWKVVEEEKEYDGKLVNTRDGREIVADQGVCGPDDATARFRCGYNNFIPPDALLNYEGGDEETPQETQTEEATDEYQDFRSETFNYESEIPENWKKREGAFLDGKAEFFELGETYIAVSRQVNREPYDLEALEFRIQSSMELARPDDNYIIPESEDYEIDGEEAKYIKGTIENNGKRFNVSEVVFIKDGNYWIIAFLSPGSDHNEVFEHFLENFSTS